MVVASPQAPPPAPRAPTSQQTNTGHPYHPAGRADLMPSQPRATQLRAGKGRAYSLRISKPEHTSACPGASREGRQGCCCGYIQVPTHPAHSCAPCRTHHPQVVASAYRQSAKAKVVTMPAANALASLSQQQMRLPNT